MKKALVAITALLLLPPLTSVALASGGTKEYRDQFKQVSYSGNDGDLTWAGPWVESPENDGASAGRVYVGQDSMCEGNMCLHLKNGLVGTPEVSAYRMANTALFSESDLFFDLSASGVLGVLGVVHVEVTKNGGQTWTEVYSRTMIQLVGQKVHPEIPIGQYLSEGFGVKFRVQDLRGGTAHIDNVEVIGVLAEGATTTTTPTTTSTQSSATTTTRPATTSTSQAGVTTSTTSPTTTSSIARALGATTSTSPRSDSTTSTTVEESTTTTAGLVVSPARGDPPDSSGIRDSRAGLQANFEAGLHGGMDMMDAEVLGVELKPNFSMAVEVIEESWIWMIGLALVIATAIVTGLDRRRATRGLQPT